MHNSTKPVTSTKEKERGIVKCSKALYDREKEQMIRDTFWDVGMDRSIPLGLFELEAPIGRGGMGEVWSGKHSQQDVPVAVKVLTEEKSRNEAYVQSFRNEVRAVARLDHPSVIRVFDYGLIPEATEERTGGRLKAGSPYLVMERATRGSLFGLCGRLPWISARKILLSLLDALAHAHAKGVIHRDIKPGNVLFRKSPSTLMLTDFGLAHAMEREKGGWDTRRIVGTPAYMAPEQFGARWRDYGPWTDLYSFGCLAYTLVSGEPPFGRSKPLKEQLQNHRHAPVPPLAPEIKVPEDFEAWLHCLMAKHPVDRFQRAADAAWTLAQMPAPKTAFSLGPSNVPSIQELPSGSILRDKLSSAGSWTALPAASGYSSSDYLASTSPAQPVQASENTHYTPSSAEKLSEQLQSLDTICEEAEKTNEFKKLPQIKVRGFVEALEDPYYQLKPAPMSMPFPITWRRKIVVSTKKLTSVGLGLYGIRSLRLVDRENQRNELWKVLQEVREQRKPRFVLLKGPAGCGKSKLVEWFTERAHEVGMASVLKAIHSPQGSPSDGLYPMLLRAMRVQDLPRPELTHRIKRKLLSQEITEPDEWYALTELLMPAAEHPEESSSKVIRFRNTAEKHFLLLRQLQRFSSDRPLLLWLDDIHWGLESLEFVQYLLQQQSHIDSPILVVATARNEALHRALLESEILDELLELPQSELMELDVLEPMYRSILVRELLGLEEELAASVEKRTAGNPLFAVQLVGDWVQRGLLQPGEDGFTMRPNAKAQLPDDLHQFWLERIERFLSDRNEGEAFSLELAALLGQEVNVLEWQTLCGQIGIQASLELVESLISQRLASCGNGGPKNGWSFIHGMMRESLERRAQDSSRLKSHHLMCAQMLASLKGSESKERQSQHLLQAEAYKKALSPLLSCVRERLQEEDFLSAQKRLHQWQEAIDQLGLTSDDLRWAQGMFLWGKVQRYLVQYSQAIDKLSQAEDKAREHKWNTLLPALLLELGIVKRIQGDLTAAAAYIQEATELARQQHIPNILFDCRIDKGRLLLTLGQVDEAIEASELLIEDCKKASDKLRTARTYTLLSNAFIQKGDNTQAKQSNQEASELFELCGVRWGMASCENRQGEILRAQGRFSEAQKHYQRAISLYQAIGSVGAVYPEINLGLNMLEWGRYRESSRIMSKLLTRFKEENKERLMMLAHVALLPSAAYTEAWPDWHTHMIAVEQLLDKFSVTEIDFARIFEIAGGQARANGKQAEAYRAYHNAYKQWKGIDRQEKSQEVQAILKEISKENPSLPSLL